MAAENTIEHWLTSQGLEQYAEVFAENDIDLRALGYLDEADLKELGVSLGHRRILLAAISALNPENGRLDAELSKPDDATTVEPERRQLTVLFCDIVGSTELGHRLDPEEMREVLREYQGRVGDSVRRYQGYVARFVGDGILAYFGWPQAFEDQAEQAVRAALDAARCVTEIEVNGENCLQARFGIDTGEVVVGDLIGEESLDEQSVTGTSPNLAARLQGIAGPSQVVIGHDTQKLIRDKFEFKDLGPQHFKGFPDEIQSWAVVRELEAEHRFDAVRKAALTGLVGREHELGLLKDRWELAKEGEGQVVLLSGEAGIGKSRMVQGFWKSIEDDTRFNLHYQCSPHHINSAFYPVIHRLQRAANFIKEDSVDAKLEKLEELLRKIGQYEPSVGALFSALLSLPGESRFGKLDLTPQQLRQRTVQALVSQSVALSQHRPVVCVVEDVHWIDPSMLEFVSELMSRASNQAIFLLITFRPENTPQWSGHHHQTSMTLNRLGRKQAARIAQSVGGKELVDAIIERIVIRADGVPLYIEELTKAVLESYTSMKGSDWVDTIPATLQSSLVARLDRLGDAKDIAQIGAVIGRDFPYKLLASVTRKSESILLSALERLEQSGLVFRQGVPPNAEYRFKHALVQDAAYATMLIRRRRDLHARIVAVLERQDNQYSNEEIDSLARHSHKAQLWDKSFSYFQLAGRNAMDRAAVREAVAQFEQALFAAAQLPQTSQSLEDAIDLRFDLRNALWAIAAFEDILVNLSEAENLAKQINDQVRIGWISVFMSASQWQLGRPSQALESAKNALLINKEPQDLSLELGANFYLGCATVTSGDCRQAESYFQKVSEALVGDLRLERCGLPFVPAVVSRSWLVWALAERGEFSQAMGEGQTALEIALEVGHPFNLAHIYYDLGYFYIVKGDIDAAVDALDHAMNYVREWSLTYLSPFIMGFLGHSYTLAGRVEEGIVLLEQAVDDYRRMGLGLFHSLVQVHYAHALLLGGRIQEAQNVAEAALELTQKRGEQGHEAHALRLLGELALHPDSPDNDGAKLKFETALTLAAKHDMRPLQAQCYFSLGRFYQKHDQQVQSQQYFEQAQKQFRELGMTPLEQSVN